jgi:hypothetical protein
MWYRTKKCCSFLFICFFFIQSYSQENQTYPVIFQGKYEEAIQFLEKERWISDSLSYYSIDAGLALSVVFPEIIRYSSIRDWAEVKSLEVLYSQYGKEYSDFSVGYFQMKPSFIERLEKDRQRLFSAKPRSHFPVPLFDTSDHHHERYLRVRRIQDPGWQVRYLALFILTMDEIYAKSHWNSKEEKLIFYATAYNTGYWKSEEAIIRAGKRNNFHTSMIKPKVCCNYAEIALDFYRRHCTGKR